MTIYKFATLVEKLRLVQKADGSGYKTPVSRDQSKQLEKLVDDAVKLILHGEPSPHQSSPA